MFVVNKMIEIPIKREEQRYAFSFQSTKQNPNFFSRKYKDFLPLKTDAMIIKQMQKSSRKTTRFLPKSHAMPMDRGMHEDEGEKIVNSEIAKEELLWMWIRVP